jgi:tRNA1(Val) A37 N6-methylase TrmN6
LELGAGGGLIGLAVALECQLQNQLLVTDQLEMYELMKHNIELNNLQDKAKAMVLNWYVILNSLSCVTSSSAVPIPWSDEGEPLS